MTTLDPVPDRPPAYTPEPTTETPQVAIAPPQTPLIRHPISVRSWKPLGPSSGMHGPIDSILFAPASHGFVFGAFTSRQDQYLRVFDFGPNHKRDQTHRLKIAGTGFAFSPDGLRVAVLADSSPPIEVRTSEWRRNIPSNKIWLGSLGFDRGTGRLGLEGKPITFNGDGTLLAVAVHGGVILLCSATQNKIYECLPVHMDEITHLVFSQGSRSESRLASCSLDGVVRVTNTQGKCIAKLECERGGARRATDLAITTDGKIVVCIWGSRVNVWWPDSGQLGSYNLNNKRGIENEAWPLALSPDGRLLASRNMEGMDVSCVFTGDVLVTITFGGSFVTAAGFSHDGRKMAVGRMDGFLELWDLCP